MINFYKGKARRKIKCANCGCPIWSGLMKYQMVINYGSTISFCSACKDVHIKPEVWEKAIDEDKKGSQ